MLNDVESTIHKRENRNVKSGKVEWKTARIEEQIIYVYLKKLQASTWNE